MATQRGPKIVTPGLLEYWDAADIKSYPRTGTIWYDLSGRSKNCTLTNGPVWSSTYGGGFVLDNTNDYITAGASGADGNMYSSSAITLTSWFNINYFLGDKTLIYNGRPVTTGVDGWYFGLSSGGGTTYLRAEIVGSNNISYGFNSSNGSYGFSVPTYAVLTYDRVNVKMYVNGVQVLSSALTQYIRVAAFADSVINIGQAGTNYPLFDGTIYSTSIYNRALSATEVLQNFNTHRGRFRI